MTPARDDLAYFAAAGRPVQADERRYAIPRLHRSIVIRRALRSRDALLRRRAMRALSACRMVVAALVASMSALDSPAAATERAADLQRKLRAPAAVSHVSHVRDVSVFGSYPPAVLPSAEHGKIPALAAKRTYAYPPTKDAPAPSPPLPACGVISDCSFENNANGWFLTDLANRWFPSGVYAAGLDPGFGLFTSAPTDGGKAVLVGWEGGGPGEVSLGQDVILQPNAARLMFDYRAGWDMFNFEGSTLPRTFSVQVRPSGGGPILFEETILTADSGSVNLDTGNLTANVDISAFAGQAVRVQWVWHVPESFTGPGIFQLDRVRVLEDDCLAIDNCSFESALLPAWSTSDLTLPLMAVQVAPSGMPLSTLTCMPTDGTQAFVHGWEGNGPGDIRLFQDVVLPAGTSTIEFDYRASWQMLGTLPRSFTFDVEPSGGGAPLASQPILSAQPNTTVLDTGPLTAHVDLREFEGQAVRLVFRWIVPEDNTGPADFQLDHVRLTQGVCASIHNCSFETGTLPAWSAFDVLSPFYPIHVGGAGENVGFDFFTTAPTSGTAAMIHGFDGAGPDAIRLFQDVTVPLWADLLRFDYRGAWDMQTFGGSTIDRTFEVRIEPAGGGAALSSDIILIAPAGSKQLDTGPVSRTFPVAAYAGQTVRIVFRWTIPENFTGPGLFQLDRVAFDNNVLAVGPGGSPGHALALRPAMPNPSRAATTFSFTLPQPGDVELEIVDVRGARVWSERHAGMPAGEHRVAWSGIRAGGGTAAPGVYYARVRTASATTSRMFVRVR